MCFNPILHGFQMCLHDFYVEFNCNLVLYMLVSIIIILYLDDVCFIQPCHNSFPLIFPMTISSLTLVSFLKSNLHSFFPLNHFSILFVFCNIIQTAISLGYIPFTSIKITVVLFVASLNFFSYENSLFCYPFSFTVLLESGIPKYCVSLLIE